MTPAQQAQLVADCIASGGHFRRTVVYVGETVERCHMCACPRGWKPPARRLTQPTGQPVVVHGPTLLPAGIAQPRHTAAPLSAIGVARDPRWSQPCGTHTGAKRHRRHGEPVCDACRAAEATYTRQRRAVRTAA